MTAASDTPAAPLISVQGLRKSFGSHEVLKGIDLDVAPGEVLTIIGASGSGKSTLLRCLNLLETPDAGHVWFDGQDLMAPETNVNALRADIGMVFQGFNLFNNLDVLDNCTLAPVTLGKLKKPEAEEVAMGHLSSVGLADFAHADSKRLSGGQKQRVAIASAVASGREVCVFDEPTSGLDWAHMLDTANNLHGLAARGVTSLVITHDPELVAACCDHVLFVEGGRASWWGRLDDAQVAKRVETFFG